MKKYLVILVMALCAAVQSNAQTTWNVRVGGGLGSGVHKDTYWDKNSHSYRTDESYDNILSLSPMISIETNIALTRSSKWCLSPAIMVSTGLGEPYWDVSLPIHLGYKIPVGESGILIPKIGPFVGYQKDSYNFGDFFLFGPSVELAYEYGHFITALNASMQTIETFSPYVFLSVGYKF